MDPAELEQFKTACYIRVLQLGTMTSCCKRLPNSNHLRPSNPVLAHLQPHPLWQAPQKLLPLLYLPQYKGIPMWLILSSNEDTKKKTALIKNPQEPSSSSVSLSNKMEKGVQDLTVVLFGNSSAVGDENILLGQPTADVADFSVIFPKSKKISGRIVNLINILDLQNNALYVDQAIVRLVQENKIHAFVFVLQLGQLTDADKVGLEWLQKKFGESVLPFVMILFTYEKLEDCDTIIDDLKKNPVLVHLVEKCGDRYHTCSKNMNNQSEMKTLLEKIDCLISENNQRCYTAELYNTASNLREGLQDSMSQQSRLPASDSQLPKDKRAAAVSKQIIEKEKVSKNSLRKTLKSLPHTTWFWKKERNLSRENIELDGAEHTQHNNEEKAVEKITSDKTDQLFTRLELKRNEKQRIKSADILQITSPPLHCQKPCTEKELVQMFIKRLLLMDYRARNIFITDGASEMHHRQSTPANKCGEKKLASFLKKNPSLNKATNKNPVHPMDVQMAVFHHSDSFLKQLIVTKLSQCQYALPLLVPSPFTGETEFPLWTFRQIKKSWMTCNTTGKKTSKMIPMHEAETPMVFFFRLGSIPSSKSQLINDLINERHKTFFHRNCLGSTRDRLLMDGVVEIAWYCPSGKSTDQFTDCVAFCNLHGDAENHKKQLEILTEMSSMNVVVLGNQDDSTTDNEALENLFEGAKPLICLLSDDDSTISWTENLKFKIGLKDRNQAVVSKELRETIKECFSTSLSTFSLKKLGKNKDISIDENKEECQKGKEAAMQIMILLERTELTTVKETYLPCQGKLWHKWCQKKKELHRLKGHNIQMQKCKKQAEMKEIRRQQHQRGLSKLIELFIHTMKSLTENEKCYFLKWLGILLDNITTDELSGFRHAYDLTWSKVLDLNGQADKSEEMKAAQTQLEEISQKLNAASFGMEHIHREMGQIYESFISVQVAKKDFTLPKIAAEVMLSGHPLELMDGDTGHVPLIWLSAVLDELIKKLGDKRVFVLSVLGIQSTGKSTMLNAMFGLQFAVSAGRCTKGAFMQLVKVSEEMKEELKFDYIVIVDTEGLRAPEFTGLSTRQQDNGLATFVVGLGNMTLINIFGENPAEMQDILQIVVQAFMRMKKVRLNPSCMFVHQNVGEVTAGERNMEGRKRFLDKLDEMTKLAAKEEDCNAKCFSDVIEFDVKSDVWYFTQLWEGSPPMAPPNPLYSENIQELKSNIISKISKKRGVTLSEFKGNFSSLWNALLDENFVFSFRNILEIALYRKLEHEYSKWTWSLRSAMLAIENRLHNRVSNENSLKIDEKDIVECMKKTKTDVETSIKKFFDEDRDKEILIQWQERFQRKIADLCNELVEGTKRKLDDVIRLKIAREKVDCEKKMYENELFKLSKNLAFCLKNKETEEDALEKEFEDVWSKWVTELTPGTPSFGDINIWGDVMQILSESCEINLVCERQNQGTYKRIDALGSYSDYIILKNQEDSGQENLPSSNEQGEEEDNNACAFGQVLKDEKHSLSQSRINTFTSDDNNSLNALITNTVTDIKAEIQKVPIAERGYSRIYIAEIIASVKHKVEAYECKTSRFILKKEFTVDLCLYVCNFAAKQFAERHKEFKEAYDVRLYLEKQRPQYLNIFKNYCSGATSTAVFGQVIVDTLEPSILQAAYNQTAIDLSEKMKCDVPAFNGNRSNLEKHILTSLAEEESFENYIQYIQKPREYFKHFIKKKVKGYVLNENCQVVLETIKSNIISKGKCVVDAVNEATEKIKSSNGNVSMWLQNLSRKLQDELQFKEKSCVEQKEIKDLDFLQEVVIKGLNNIIPKLSNSFQDISDLKWEMFRKKPDDILIEHLCRCCWAQCPFCNAICTNTMEDHTGDHSVRFHRNCGTNGWSYILKNELGIEFCTTLVSSDLHFRANDRVLCFKDYRTAGGEYGRWNISPDNSEMPYWKWFVCRFQEDLEKHYKRKFIGHGEIPSEWRDCFKDKAIESLSEL